MFRKSILSLSSLSLSLAVPLVPAVAQAQPTPFALAAGLDLECRPAQGAPPAANVVVRQLNPVLKDKIPVQNAKLGGLAEVCVPVAKNGQLPPPNALAIDRWVDLSCFDAEAAPISVDVKVSHINPQLVNLPDEAITLTKLEQICLPVRKNGAEPESPAIKQMIAHFDFGCYGLAEPTSDANTTLVLSHLNPVIQQMNLPDRTVTMRRGHQLCVPIAKNNQPVPLNVQPFVQWIDFLKYRVEPTQQPPALPLWLAHLNPLYAGQDPYFTVLMPDRMRLMVPIAKDGHLPPGAPGHD
jgi:hypothetical protein